MFCKNCGGTVEDGATFCPYCGKKVESENIGSSNNNYSSGSSYNTSGSSNTNYNTNSNYGSNNYNANSGYGNTNYNTNANYGNSINSNYGNMGYVSEEYRPISMWGYFGYEILFAIPIVGFILKIVFAITSKNKNLKNFALAYLIIEIVVFVIILLIASSTGISIFNAFR